MGAQADGERALASQWHEVNPAANIGRDRGAGNTTPGPLL